MDYKSLIKIGIQGGRGSFSEEAALAYCLKEGITNYSLEYLYTTKKVLHSVSTKQVNLGVFAIHNSTGGVVWESARALAEYKVNLVEEFYIVITHHLMKKRGVPLSKISKIIAHPQVFKQCKSNLEKFYPNLEQVVGEGDYIDTAKAAEAVSKGSLPFNYAVLGPKSLSSLYDLEIVKSDLQDLENNRTYFFTVSFLAGV